MIGRLFGVAILLIAALAGARAETIVCYGDNDCTAVSASGTRKLTPDETLARRRDKSRERVSDVDCSIAMDRTACDAAKRALLGSLGR